MEDIEIAIDSTGISIALFTIIRTDRNMLLACYSHKHISYRIRTIIRKANIMNLGHCAAVDF
ncbi:hypothetical protein [Wolbachia endosymbiont (group A) of Scambus nigricans]|uniref:hypothetical protein n=1 Tax=Wolbachia endosymbiont (group A) of Scambus nigricans TaxID=2954055 RepID=UPI0022321941|nr:hypothetical protein [Wolbachia endosymbiont (group A) of Scambus nigricans]